MSDKNYIISIEGHTVPVPTEVGTLGDDELKRALTPMFPGAANSQIERAEKDGTQTITVVKLTGDAASASSGRPGSASTATPVTWTPGMFSSCPPASRMPWERR